MKKSILFISALLALSMTACGTNADSSEPVTPSTPADNNIIHGHGAPNNNQGSLYSLYVDDDTGKIYEKNKAYSTPVGPAVKFAQNRGGLGVRGMSTNDNDIDEAKWIYTNCVAGDNFDKNSSIANALRATLLSTNITLKCTLSIDQNGSHLTDTTTYLAYNYGSVLQKYTMDPNDGFDDATLVGYSIYNIDATSDATAYELFINEYDGIHDRTSYITSEDVGEKMIASNFINRCLNNQLENTCNFALCDSILGELDNFVVADGVHKLNKTITINSSPYYDLMYGAGNYYIEFKNIEFKLSADGNSLDNFKFTFGYGKNDRSQYLEEDFFAEISNLRTTSFVIE